MCDNELSAWPIPKLLLKYSIPAIISMVVSSLYGIVDRIFIGNIPDVGNLAISGVAATTPVTSLISAFAALVGVGMATSISLRLGEQNKKHAEGILGNGLTLSIVVSLVITLLGMLFCGPLLALFGTGLALIPYAQSYLNIILAGTVFSITGQCLNSTIRADGSPVIASVTMLISCIINIVLDPLFIFVFGLGIMGAAIATVISQATVLVWVLWYYLGSGKATMRLLRSNLRLKAPVVFDIAALGASNFMLTASASITQGLYIHFLTTYGGDNAVGSYAILTSVSSLALMVMSGTMQGMLPIVGYNYGAKNYLRVKRTFLLALVSSTIYLTACAVLIALFPQHIASLFNRDPELVSLSVVGLRFTAMAMPLFALSIMGRSFFVSIGRKRASLVLSFLRQFGLMLPGVILLTHFLGLYGVYMNQIVCDVVYCFIIVLMLVFEFRRMRTLEKPQSTIVTQNAV